MMMLLMMVVVVVMLLLLMTIECTRNQWLTTIVHAKQYSTPP